MKKFSKFFVIGIIFIVIIIATIQSQIKDNVEIINDYEIGKILNLTVEEIIIKAEESELKEKILNFLQSKGMDIDLEITFFEVTDLDLDNNKDIVVTFGDKSSKEYEKVFIVEDEGSDFSYYEIESYNISRADKIDVIEFNGFDYPFIHVVIENFYENPFGFVLYIFSENKIEEYLSSATGTNSGYDAVFDSDDDGLYDGYSQYRPGYDYLLQNVYKEYLMENGEFILDKYEISLREYPETPDELVLYYITLSELQHREKTDIKVISDYLKEMTLVDVVIDHDKIDGNIIDNTRIGLEPYLSFDTKVEGNIAEVVVYLADEDEEKNLMYKFNFENIDDKWVISEFY